MYEEYFGLNRPPFRITPDTSLFYDGGHRGDILGALVYAVHRGEGIIKVVGEVGSGKTMLCRMLQTELPDSIEIIYIANPSVSPEDILFVIASELKFKVARDASKHELVSMLHDYLLKKHAEDKQVVMFVEEAQGMPIETLEEIRLLSNLETDQHKLLQMILFGQPELDENLAQNSIRQLRERITHDFNLSPLTGDEIHRYLNFRMREVGYTGPELINRKLADKMAKYSEGLLRRINILADKMLLSAFAEDTHTLTSSHLLAAVNDSGFGKLNPTGSKSYKWLWASGIIFLLMILLYALLQGQYLTVFQKKWAETVADLKSPVVNTGKKPAPLKSEEVVAVETNEEKNSFEEPEPNVKDQVESDLVVAKNEKRPQIEETEVEKVALIPQKMLTNSKKTLQSADNLDIVNSDKAGQSEDQQSQAVKALTSSKKYEEYELWINAKIESSKRWLRNADKQHVSIQVLMRSKSAARELVEFLKTEWPLELEKTYLYEVKMKDKEIYRVFYDEYPSITLGQIRIKQLPESVRVNSPYLHSVYRMQKALL